MMLFLRWVALIVVSRFLYLLWFQELQKHCKQNSKEIFDRSFPVENSSYDLEDFWSENELWSKKK